MSAADARDLLLEGEDHLVRSTSRPPSAREVASDTFARRRGTRSLAGRSWIARRVQIRRPAADPAFDLRARPGPERGIRTMLASPMLREGAADWRAIVSFGARRFGRSRERQSELLKTFADQAVIAIENVRLFTELRGAEQRASGGARAADRDQRAAQGDRAVHVRSQAGVRDAGRECGQVMRGRARLDLPFRRAGAATHGQPQRLRRADRISGGKSLAPGPLERRGTGRGRTEHGTDPGCARRPGVQLWSEAGGRGPDRPGDPDAPRGRAAGRDHDLPARGPVIRRQSDRPDGDLRRPGGHRDRERPAAHRAAGRAPPSSRARSGSCRRWAR